MAWTYKKYSDSSATKNADKNRQTIYSQKPGEFKYNSYKQSQTVKDWYNKMNSLEKPGAYNFSRQADLDSVMDKYLNRDAFTYDVNGDALYQQYKDQYVTQGKMAMMDTMGQAAAATGGFGNSYAQSVGQQAYQGYLQQLTDKIPELYQLALSKYSQEGEELYNQYGMLSDADSREYGKYRDTVTDYYTDRDYYTNQYNTERQWDYNQWSDGYDRAYDLHRDSVGDWQYLLDRADSEYWNNKNFDWDQYSDDKGYSYQLNRDDIEDSQWQKEYDLDKDTLEWSKNNSNAGGDPDETPEPEPEPEIDPTETGNTNSFIANHLTKDEFMARGDKTYKQYLEYIEGELNKMNLTDGEFAYLYNYYRLG